MRISGLPKSEASASLSNADRWSGRLQEAEIQPLRREQSPEQSLNIDLRTLKDLEVFECNSDLASESVADTTTKGTAKSLFDLCNFTHTRGGAEMLRQRMRTPWSSAARIQETQQALNFIRSNRVLFEKLPSYITTGVEKYQRETVMLVTQTNPLEFYLHAFSLRLNHERHYNNILRDVQTACYVIRDLRKFIAQQELASADGELRDLLDEMRNILHRPWIERIPEKELDACWHWTVLRIDQIIRLHEKQGILRLLQLIYEIDALVSMSDATQHLRLTLPTLADGAVRVVGEGLRHIQLGDAISNPVQLDQDRRVLFLTGPNMAGKTTYLRAFATALYFAHLGMGVPATEFSFVPVQCLFSSISLNDDLHSGISYFRAEALRMKDIAKAIAAGHKVVAVMDEPFKGTNVKDAFDVSLEVLKRIAYKADCLFMFSSHLIELDAEFADDDPISRYHFKAQEDRDKLGFDFLLRPGTSNQRLGIRVLKEEGVFDILDQQPEFTG